MGIIVFLTMLAFAIILSGCSKKVSESQAKKYMLSYLKKKYNEEFEITGIEIKSNSDQMVTRRWYRFDVRSKETDVEFSCTCSCNRIKKEAPIMADEYEKRYIKNNNS